MLETIVITIIICCGGLFGTYYSNKKRQIVLQQKRELINKFFDKIHIYEGSLQLQESEIQQNKQSQKDLMQQVYRDFYEISTKYKNLCIFQQVKSEKDNQHNLQEIHQFLTKLIKLYPMTINILDLKEDQMVRKNQSNKNFKNHLVNQLKQDLEKKQIMQEEIYLLQIILLMTQVFHLKDSIEYVCYQAPQIFNNNSAKLLQYLRQILIYKISCEDEKTIEEQIEKLFQNNDFHFDKETLRQIFSVPQLTIEQKKLIVKKEIFSLKDSNNLMSIFNNYCVNYSNSGDFMCSFKLMIQIYKNAQ